MEKTLNTSNSEQDKEINAQMNEDRTSPNNVTTPRRISTPGTNNITTPNTTNRQIRTGVPAPQDATPGTGVPMNRGTSPGTGMPMNRGTSPGTGIPMNRGTSPGTGMPMNNGMMPGTGMPMNRGMMPGTGMPINNGMMPGTGMPMPIATPYNTPMGIPLVPLYGYDNCEDSDQDIAYFKQLYPSTARRIQNEAENECDKLEFDGSIMFDEYPDRVALDRIIDRIYDKIKDMDESPQVEINSFYMAPRRQSLLRDLINIVVLNEIFNRRRRYRSRRRWF